jgi:hypothetical protein
MPGKSVNKVMVNAARMKAGNLMNPKPGGEDGDEGGMRRDSGCIAI